MRAVKATSYGAPDVLEIREVPKPIIKDDEILVQVKAASLNSGDVRMRAMDAGDGLQGFVGKFVIRLLVGIKKPKRTPGGVLAGVVTKVGKDTSRFKVGDEVYAMTGFSFGAFAEYCALPEKRAIALKPKSASFEEASALPFGGNTALYFLRKAGLKKGSNVLINGSTGAVGSSAVQVAAYYGANVTAICGPDGTELTKKLGAKKVYDYKQTTLQDIDGTFDIVFDAVGKISKASSSHLLKDGGVYTTVASLDVAKELSSDLEILATMFDEGKLDPVIDKTFTLEQIVEANKYVDSGHKKGNVIIKIDS